MGMNMAERYAVIREASKRYQGAGKGVKMGVIRDVVKLTGLHPNYVGFLLRNWRREWTRDTPRGRIAVQLRVAIKPGRRRRRWRKPSYDAAQLLPHVKELWEMGDYICGKRLAAFIIDTLPALARSKELTIPRKLQKQILRMSPATLDRMLKKERAKHLLKARHGTKPGTLLKHQIPVRTFAQWNDAAPGFSELDLVAHAGGNASGDFCQTLTVTDVATGWTENCAVPNKAQSFVFQALKDIRQRLPFPLLGIDSDNGGEFINHHLKTYCETERITFTRSRAHRSNDNCYVEQKNYTVVRRTVGYQRYDTAEEIMLLNSIYTSLRLYVNFFQPSMKLISKTRDGSKVSKRYDRPLTPFRRVLAHAAVSPAIKQRLRRRFLTLNPAELKRTINTLVRRLTCISSHKKCRVPACLAPHPKIQFRSKP
jgi:hypothetical protein